ncbi:uncharacterized protein LOC106866476 [Brachypodium distachyon]|uniref:Uncharacterized protein n=1 Tax=Brachypodium distachyon TaxID=15368 RepID=I1I735_BRADI|nr:uncharacterized protein LOC106866476 [Brachypodium distachyon]KQJ98291.1 hypothetical protein BRADI_3g36000v3 [Brachypodium distachyon]|eukprot:XP_014756226.1 uncharacterized protein LOC106866476 [Brachypodium distachyon]
MAIADAVVPSPPRITVAGLVLLMRLALVAAAALSYLSLASAWVAWAACAVLAVGSEVGRRAWCEAGSLVASASLKVLIFAVVLLGMLALALLLAVCAMVRMGFLGCNFSSDAKKSFGPAKELIWELLRDTRAQWVLASLTSYLISTVTRLVIGWLLPVMGSDGGKIGSVIVTVAFLGALTIITYGLSCEQPIGPKFSYLACSCCNQITVF